MFAAKNKNKNIIIKLLKKGANPNIENEQGKTAFDYAITSLDFEIINFFFINSSVSIKQEKIDNALLNLTNLSIIASTKLIDLFIFYNASPFIENDYGQTPLLNAIKNSTQEVIDTLLEYTLRSCEANPKNYISCAEGIIFTLLAFKEDNNHLQYNLLSNAIFKYTSAPSTPNDFMLMYCSAMGLLDTVKINLDSFQSSSLARISAVKLAGYFGRQDIADVICTHIKKEEKDKEEAMPTSKKIKKIINTTTNIKKPKPLSLSMIIKLCLKALWRFIVKCKNKLVNKLMPYKNKTTKKLVIKSLSVDDLSEIKNPKIEDPSIIDISKGQTFNLIHRYSTDNKA